jgi:Tol biopolymer transport system component
VNPGVNPEPGSGLAATGVSGDRPPRLRRALALLLVAMAVLALAVPAVRHMREQPPPPPAPMRASWVPPSELTIGAGPDYPFGLALAPDGRRLAFAASRGGEPELWLQDLGTGAARALPGTVAAALPFWSPDGRHIAFFAAGRLRAIDLDAGTVADLAEAPAPRGGAWNAAGDIIFAPRADGGLVRRGADGKTTTLTSIDPASEETSHRWPAFVDRGRLVVFLSRHRERSRDGLRLVSLDGAAGGRIATTDAGAVVSGETIVFASGEALVAQRLDPAARALTGRAELIGVPVGRGAQQQLLATTGGDALIFAPPVSALRELVRVDREGARLGTIGGPAETFDVRLSPDGGRAAVTQIDPQLGTLDVFVYDGARPVPSRRVSPATGADESAVWSPDGAQLAWLSGRRTLTVRGVGAVLPEETAARVAPPARVTDWSPDRQWIVFSQRGDGTGDDIWAVKPHDPESMTAVVRSAFNDVHGTVSPDGRWIAWASDDSGRFEVYADRFPTPQGRIKLTAGGGSDPRWRRDGRELYFRRGSEIHAAALALAGGTLDILSTARRFAAGADLRDYDARRDGSGFVLNLPADPGPQRPATLLLHWTQLIGRSSAGGNDPQSR